MKLYFSELSKGAEPEGVEIHIIKML